MAGSRRALIVSLLLVLVGAAMGGVWVIFQRPSAPPALVSDFRGLSLRTLFDGLSASPIGRAALSPVVQPGCGQQMHTPSAQSGKGRVSRIRQLLAGLAPVGTVYASCPPFDPCSSHFQSLYSVLCTMWPGDCYFQICDNQGTIYQVGCCRKDYNCDGTICTGGQTCNHGT